MGTNTMANHLSRFSVVVTRCTSST